MGAEGLIKVFVFGLTLVAGIILLHISAVEVRNVKADIAKTRKEIAVLSAEVEMHKKILKSLLRDTDKYGKY